MTVEKALWQQDGAEKREAVRRMFADIAPAYDRLNALMSLALHKRWRAEAVRLIAVREGEKALDVCCGTGDFLLPLGQGVGQSGVAVGADYCGPMLDVAAKKLPGSRLALADACALPFASESFDAVTVGWGLRNLADLNQGLREVVRVLKPGGRFVSLDMATPQSPVFAWGSRIVCGRLLPALGATMGKREAYAYLPKSAERFASRAGLKAAFESAGLQSVQLKDFLFGNICAVWGTKP